MKKFLSLLLVFAVAAAMVCAFAVNVSADEVSGDYEYVIEDGTATITKYTGDSENVTIPSTLDGYPVTAIGDNAFLMSEHLEKVTIPGSVVSIGNGAFSSCWRLTTVTISEGVKSICPNAFCGCGCLTKVTIPESVDSIGVEAFADSNPGLAICGQYGSFAETYARNNRIPFEGSGVCNHIFSCVCDSCKKSVTKSELLKAWGENNLSGSILSGGSLTIICSAVCLAVGFLAAMFIFKKKKPATAGGTGNTDEE